MVMPIIISAVILMGTIADKTAPVAVFSMHDQEAKVATIGDVIDGWKIVEVDPKRVTMTKGGKRQAVEVGQEPHAVEVMEAVKAKGNQVTISSDMKTKLGGTDLARTMMQTCSEPVILQDGSTVGYKLFEIDEGSIFQVVGFTEGDVITDIDGKPLDSPVNAMSALMGVKKKDRFTVSYMRGGVSKKLEVSVQ